MWMNGKKEKEMTVLEMNRLNLETYKEWCIGGLLDRLDDKGMEKTVQNVKIFLLELISTRANEAGEWMIRPVLTNADTVRITKMIERRHKNVGNESGVDLVDMKIAKLQMRIDELKKQKGE